MEFPNFTVVYSIFFLNPIIRNESRIAEMGNDFISYIARLESMAFFAGYPIIYTFLYFLAGEGQTKRMIFFRKLPPLLPYAYALIGILFLGLQLKNMYPHYSLNAFRLRIFGNYTTIWGILAILFWIPALSKKTIFSLLHSLLFFYFFAKDVFLQTGFNSNKETIRTDMQIYLVSILLNIIALLLVIAMHSLFLKGEKNSS